MPPSKTIKKPKKVPPRSIKGGTKNNTYKKVMNLIGKPNSYYAFNYSNENMWPSKNYETSKIYLEETPVNEINESKLAKLLQDLEEVQLNKYEPNELAELRALVVYENYPHRGHIFSGRKSEIGDVLNELTIEKRIRNILAKQPPLKKEKIVWRGQNKVKRGPQGENIEPECKIEPLSWFSTSTKKQIAKGYALRGRCLFKIHLMPGVCCFDLYDIYKQYGMTNPYKEQMKVRALRHHSTYKTNMDYSQYGEVIVEEGGTFYKDPEKKEEGFKYVGKDYHTKYPRMTNKGEMIFEPTGNISVLDVFETWYAPPPEDYQASNEGYNSRVLFGEVLNNENFEDPRNEEIMEKIRRYKEKGIKALYKNLMTKKREQHIRRTLKKKTK
jgi:hypothetical protein